MKVLKFYEKEGKLKLRVDTMDDLWTLQRIIFENDFVKSESLRKFKSHEGSEGEMKEVVIKIRVEKILDSLGRKSKTLTDLSNELNLAPSTVAEHIQGLLDMHAIQEIDDVPRKWKYYEIRPGFSAEQYGASFLRRQGFILSIGIVIAIAVIGSLVYITSSNYQQITSCIPKPGYICGSPQVASTSGALSLVLGGQNRTIAVQGIGCSYNSSPPSTFTPYHATLAANEGARLNVTCPQQSAQQQSQATVVHIWLNYTSNGVGVVAEVANVTRPPVYYTTIPPTTTVPFTTVATTTVPAYSQNGGSNGTVLSNVSGGGVVLANNYQTYICAAGSYVGTLKSVSWVPDATTVTYSSIGRADGNICSALLGTSTQDNDLAIAGIGVPFQNPIVYQATGVAGTGTTMLNYTVPDPQSTVVIAVASGGGTFVTGIQPSGSCAVEQHVGAPPLPNGGVTPVVYIAYCTQQAQGTYSVRVTGISGPQQYYYGNGWVSIAAYVFPSGLPPTTTSTYTTVPSTSTATTSSVVTTTAASTTTIPNSCGLLYTVYVGNSISCSPWTAQLTDLSQPSNQTNASAADINIYYSGTLTNVSQIYPNHGAYFDVGGHYLYVYVNQTFAGLYAYQKWAKMSMSQSAGTTTVPTTSTTSTTVTTSASTTVQFCTSTNITTLYINNTLSCNGLAVMLRSTQASNSSNTATYNLYFNGSSKGTATMSQNSSMLFNFSNQYYTLYAYNIEAAPNATLHWARTQIVFHNV